MTGEHEPTDRLADELFAAARQERPDDSVRARAKHLALTARAGINAVEARGPLGYAPLFAAAIALMVLAFVAAGGLREREHAASQTIVVTPEAVERIAAGEPKHDGATSAARTEQRAQVVQAAPPLAMRPQPKRATRVQPSLAEEIALLDQARSALAGRQSARVIALVEQYERELGGTRMRAEAGLLRIEALAQSGERVRAAQLARRFAEEHAGNPLAERARTLAKIEEHSEDPE